MEPVIFNIQRMSMHDGPGIRTTVFFKGCSLKCKWCHNPESIGTEPEIEWNPELCIRCGDCITNCHQRARYTADNKIFFLREQCTGCGRCAEVCVSNAIRLIGKKITIEDILKEIEKDEKVYHLSGGGVTLSGGEPLLQADVAAELLYQLKKRNIHTAVDTAGNVPWQAFEKVMQDTDLFLYDIKHLEEEEHKRYTGVSNKRILENFLRLPEKKDVYVRIPVVKGVNDICLDKIANFLKARKNVRMVELLPYHELAGSKYRALGQEEKKFAPPDGKTLEEALDHFKKCGIPVTAGGRI